MTLTEIEKIFAFGGQVFKAAITDEQAEILRRWIGIARYLWNLMLSQRENYKRNATLLEIHYAQEAIKDELEACTDKEERKAVREKMWEQFPLVNKRTVSRNSQSAELTELRNAVDWIGELPHTPARMIVNDLDKAMKRWYDSLKDPTGKEKVGYPQHKAKHGGEGTISFCRNSNKTKLSCQLLNKKWGAILISKELPNYSDSIKFTKDMHYTQKTGWIKFRIGEEPWLDETLTRLTLTDTPQGWQMTVGWKWEDVVSEFHLPAEPNIIAIDLGAKIPIAWWDGVEFGFKYEPESLKEVEDKIKEAQKYKDRCKKGSFNWLKANDQLRRLHQKKRRITDYFCEYISSWLANNYDVVIFENLNIKAMTKSAKGTKENPGTGVAQKRGLNHVMRRIGLGKIVARTKQKMEAMGKICITVGAAWTSIDCSKCGHSDPENRTTRSLFECTNPECDHQEHADVNAARNIRTKGIKKLEEMGLF